MVNRRTFTFGALGASILGLLGIKSPEGITLKTPQTSGGQIGYKAIESITGTGCCNTAFGYNALTDGTNLDKSIAIGYNAGNDLNKICPICRDYVRSNGLFLGEDVNIHQQCLAKALKELGKIIC